MARNKLDNRIRETAQRLADVEIGDFGTLGGNVAPELTNYVLGLQGADRLMFVELYLAELKVRLLSPGFCTKTSYETRVKNFNPRS